MYFSSCTTCRNTRFFKWQLRKTLFYHKYRWYTLWQWVSNEWHSQVKKPNHLSIHFFEIDKEEEVQRREWFSLFSKFKSKNEIFTDSEHAQNAHRDSEEGVLDLFRYRSHYCPSKVFFTVIWTRAIENFLEIVQLILQQRVL